MTKVITYGTYDLLHYGHIKLLERAKALGDHLIVGVTADDFDITRGKINVQQSLMERVEAVRATGIADEIIIEEYEGQKIDDILRYDVDIFTVGSDWKGKFDYLNEYCKVVYLDRTEGVSSSDIRSKSHEVRIGLIGNRNIVNKFANESKYVNGISITGIVYDDSASTEQTPLYKEFLQFADYSSLLDASDAVYIATDANEHYTQIKKALSSGKNVICESPICLSENDYSELKNLADKNNCILMDSIKTAYSTAYYRLLLLIKSGIIGDIVSVDSTCTSLFKTRELPSSLHFWGPTALLPIFQILGSKYIKHDRYSVYSDDNLKTDIFTRLSFEYEKAVASIKVGTGIKSEGELIISGTKGYITVPAPWWKTDYFELRFEDQNKNRRYFYPLEGEGIRYEIVAFVKAIESNQSRFYISDEVTKAICEMMTGCDR